MAQTSPSAPVTRSRSHRLDRLRVRHLRLLELVSAHGSLTGAATALDISQPSATKMLQEIEHAFGATLVQRSGRGGELSTAGQHALGRLRVALGALEAASHAMDSDAQRPLVRVGTLPLAGVSLVPDALALLAERGEPPRIELHEGRVTAMVDLLVAGQVDCVIGRVGDVQAHGAERFSIEPLSDEGFEVACAPAHPLARRRKLALAELQTQPWIASPRGSYTRQVFDAAFVSMGLLPPVPEVESPSFHTSLATAARTRLLAFAPRSAVQLYADNRRVHRLSLAQPFQPDYAAFITLRDVPELPSVAQLRAALADAARRPIAATRRGAAS